MNARAARPGFPSGTTVTYPDGHCGFVRHSPGTEPPVLLLHGWSANADLNYAPVYPTLADHALIAPDLRGHSDGPRGRFSLEQAADDAAHLIETFASGPAIVVGYSMGGAVTQHLVHRHPHLVAGTVYAATAARFVTHRTRPLFAAANVARQATPRVPSRLVNIALSTVLGPAKRLPDTWTWAAEDLARHDWVTILHAAAHLARHDGHRLITPAGPPACTVLTTRDTTVPPARQRELATLAGAYVIQVDVGHTAPATHPEPIAEGVAAAVAMVASTINWAKAA